MSKCIYQTGTIRSLLQGVYDGDMTISEVAKHGNMGLGTFDAVDGELIAYAGRYYRADETGLLKEVSGHTPTPFAVVADFNVATGQIVQALPELSALESWILQQMPSQNYPYAVTVEGEFKSIHLRSESCQTKPYRPLAETLPKLQTSFVKNHIHGVMVGVWFPEYMSALNVPGFHFHFIDLARQVGGHVFAIELIKAEVRLQQYQDFSMHLIKTDEFAQADLSCHDENAVAAVEKQR
jgi:acetolactate decarboxylase